MTHGRLAGLALSLALPLALARSNAIQDVAETLRAAEERHDQALRAARELVLGVLARSVEAGASEELVARVQADRQAFEEQGVLPASAPEAARKFERTRREQTDALDRAFEKAVSAYRSESKHELAAEVEARAKEHFERSERARWEDLRVQDGFELVTGGRWQGPSVLLDRAGEKLVRLPVFVPKGAGYRVELVLERTEGDGGVQLLLPRADDEGRELAFLTLGGFGGRRSGLELVDGKTPDDNASTSRDDVLPNGRSRVVVLESTVGALSAKVDGEQVLRWTEFGRLALPEGVAKRFKREKRALLVIVPEGTAVRIDSARLLDLAAEPAPAAAKAKVKPEPRSEQAPPPDRLALGTRLGGTWTFAATARCDVEVSARGPKTASLRVTGEKKSTFRFDLETVGDGSKFKIVGLQQVSAGPGERILQRVLEKGQGRVDSKGRLTMEWDAQWRDGGQRGSWSGELEASPK